MRASLEREAGAPTGREIDAAVAEGVRAPLAALRASMESLSHAFLPGDPRSLALRGALDEVVRLGHEMQTILDLALPPSAASQSCSGIEIALAARAALPRAKRERVLLAVEDRAARLEVDGTLLSRALSRLLATAVDLAEGPVLLRSRRDGDAAVLAVVHASCGTWSGDASATRFRSASSALGAQLARRDVERMGGSFRVRGEPQGSTLFEIRFPVQVPAEARG